MADVIQAEAALGTESGVDRRSTFGTGGTWRYVGLKVLGSIASLFFVVCLNFVLFRMLPGDPAKMLTRNHNISAAQIAELRKTFGLDDPLPVQFWHYLVSLLHGNLGISYKFEQPVTSVASQWRVRVVMASV